MTTNAIAPVSDSPRGSPALRRAVMWVGTRCLRWYYRDQVVLHADRVPASGAVLLVGNHPNDLPDVLLGYFATHRPVRYLATVSAATGWLSRKTYEWLGVVPVARVQDMRKMRAAGVDVVAINRAATDAVAAAFAAGDLIGAFPEGGVRDVCELASFRTGVASMALKYVETGAENDVTVVPFGLQYEAPRTHGSDVLTVVGPAFSIRQWLAAQPEGERSPAALTRAMHDAVRAVTRNSPSWELAHARDVLVAARAALANGRAPLAATPEWLGGAAVIAASESEPAVRCRTAASALAAAVQRAGGISTSALDHARLLFALDVAERPAPVPTAVLWMGLSAAAIGWAAHGPPFAAIRLVAARMAKARADVVAYSYVPGLYVVAGWYLLLAALGAVLLSRSGASPLWVLPVVAVLPLFGDLAVGWLGWCRAWRLVQRVQHWSTPERSGLRDAATVLAAEWEAATHPTPTRLD
jgi:1-acyl-sn-glycerol-3-phosphate acyltransferase